MADKPVTREEKYLAYLTGDYTGEIPKPITRKEKYLYELCLKGIGGEISPEEIKNAVNEYLEKNPVKPGATTEQAQQIEQNKTDIGSLKTETGSLKEDISNKITKFYASNQGETHITDSDNGKIQDMMLYGKSSQDGVPTPENPVEIKSVVNPTVKVGGENLYPGSDLIGLTKAYTTDFIPVILHKGKIYFSFDTSSDTSDGRYHINTKYFDINKELMGGNGNESIAGNNISHVSFEFDGTKAGINHETIDLKNVSYVKIMFGIYATTATKITYKNIMISATDSDFEPYKPIQTVTLPYTLNAIPVESGGNVTIDGQQYIADYVDVERGKIVQMVQREKLMNIADVSLTNAACDEYVFDYADSTKFRYDIVGIINIANFDDISGSNNNETRGVFAVTWGKIYLRVSKMALPQTIEDMKKWLNNNDLYFVLPLISPIETDLTTEQTQALKELATYYPVTNISINSEQIDGYTIFNYPISMANGWNYVKKQLNDNRDYIYDMDLQSAEAYVNSEYAVALTELEV